MHAQLQRQGEAAAWVASKDPAGDSPGLGGSLAEAAAPRPAAARYKG